MNKSIIQKTVVCCLLSVVCFACTKNDYSSYCPTWKGFTYTTGNYPDYHKGSPGNNIYLHPGDSIHLTAHQDERGHLINKTEYYWYICYDTLNNNGERIHVSALADKKPTNYDGYADGADDPVGQILLPANALPTEYGSDTIKFVAYYWYSGQGVIVENGNIVDNTSYNGRITPQSGPTGGGAAGYFYFYVIN